MGLIIAIIILISAIALLISGFKDKDPRHLITSALLFIILFIGAYLFWQEGVEYQQYREKMQNQTNNI